MTPVDQTQFTVGNCLSACIATVTGIPIAKVPHFCADHAEADWYPQFASWLNTRGFSPLSLSFDDREALEMHLEWARRCGPNATWIAGGDTPGGRHFVVYVGTKLFHDPNPLYGRTGLSNIQDATFLLRAAG